MPALLFIHKPKPAVLTKSLYTCNTPIFDILLFIQQNMKWVTRETNKNCGSTEPDTTAANGDAQLAGNATPPIKSETQKSGHPI